MTRPWAGDYALWLLGGFLVGFGVISLPSIGMFVLPVALLVLVVAGRLTRGSGWPALFVGASLPLFWVAATNLGGPGYRTWESTDGTSGGGTELLDPRPWALAGLVLLVVGVSLLVSLGAHAALRRRSGPADHR